MKFIIDDEGVECFVDVDGFGTVVFLFADAYKFCDDFNIWIDDVKKIIRDDFGSIINEIGAYLTRVYNSIDANYKLEHVYIYPEDSYGTFGLMFRLDIDVEHGVGVKLDNYKVIKVGSADVAFC